MLPRPPGLIQIKEHANRDDRLELRRSVLLPYSAESMFDLIERAEAYPEFLPWCTRATIHERGDDWVSARLEFSYLQIRFGFQTSATREFRLPFVRVPAR